MNYVSTLASGVQGYDYCMEDIDAWKPLCVWGYDQYGVDGMLAALLDCGVHDYGFCMDGNGAWKRLCIWGPLGGQRL